ncbi:MAG: dockerin type I domain-containing protein [Halobacteriota archaeon]
MIRRGEVAGKKAIGKLLNCLLVAVVLLSALAFFSGTILCAAGNQQPPGPEPTGITVTVAPTSIPADGTAESNITAHAMNDSKASDGYILIFEIVNPGNDTMLIPNPGGGRYSGTAVWDMTDDNGYAYAKLKAGTTAGDVTIKVSRGNVYGTATVTLTEHSGTANAPGVTNANASLLVIPEDTDNDPLWGELTNLSVVVTDASSTITSKVTVNLSSIGGSATQAMTPGGDNVWYYETNALTGSARFESGSYVPHLLQVNATNDKGYSNTTVSIALIVMKNGDVNKDGDTTYSDAMYLYKWKAKKPGFDTIYESIADVNGDSGVTYSDAMYLYKWKADKPSFDALR